MTIKRTDQSRASKDFRKVSTLVGQGQQAHSPSGRFVYALAEAVGLPPESVIDGGVKGEKRIVEKAKGRYNGSVEKVGDIKRFRVLFSHPSQISALREKLGPKTGGVTRFRREWAARGINVLGYDDYYKEPKEHGYIGFHINLEADLKKGRKAKCEVQFMHENMQLTDKLTHAIYEAKREIEDGAEGRPLTKAEKETIKGYNESLRNLYEADALNYGLDVLRSPGYELKKKYRPSGPQND